MPESETIWIVTEEIAEETKDTSKGGDSSHNPYYPPPKQEPISYRRSVQVSVKKVEAKMTEFLQAMGGLLSRARQQIPEDSGMQLDEVELAVEISGEGEVKLLGTGGKAGTKGAITLKFKRK